MSATLEPGIGQQLAAARQAKGLSTADVAEKLKLTARQIEALEAEEYERLPAAVFVRGFVRNYARLVGLAPEALVPSLGGAQAATETITAPSEGVTISSSPIKRWMIYLAAGFALFLLLVAILYNWLSQGEKALLVEDPAAVAANPAPAEPPAASTPTTPAPAPVPAPESAPTTPGAPPPANAPSASPTPVGQISAPAAPPPAPAPAKPPLAPTPATPAPANVPQPTPPSATQAAIPAGTGVVRMTAREESWVEVVDGNGKRMHQYLPGGATATLRGVPPFKVTIGNAAGVQLRYNEQLIDLQPFTGDRVARLTLE
jgi:cytoskeleton protein RodZ